MADIDGGPANLIVLFGPPAVGKTAVGRELARRTGYALYHSHLTMDVLTEFFTYEDPSFLRLHRLFTRELLEEAAQRGMSTIWTTGWRFDFTDPNCCGRRHDRAIPLAGWTGLLR